MKTTKRSVGRPQALTPQQQREVVRLRAEGATYPALAKKYRVGIGTIDRAIRRVHADTNVR